MKSGAKRGRYQNVLTDLETDDDRCKIQRHAGLLQATRSVKTSVNQACYRRQPVTTGVKTDEKQAC